MRITWSVLTAAIAALPLAAGAQEALSGVYIGAAAGVGLRHDVGLTNAQALAAQVMRQVAPVRGDSGNRGETKVGPAAAVSLGYGFGNGLRVELEGTGRRNELDGVRLNGQTLRSTSGWVGNYGPMVNLLYERSLGQPLGLPLSAYIGGGGGYLLADYRKLGGTTANGRTLVDLHGSSWALAYQGIAGVALALDGITPGLALTTEYRYLGLADNKVKALVQDRVSPAAVRRAEVKVTDNGTHTVLVGLRYAFGAAGSPLNPPPSAPLVQPPPAPSLPVPVARTFIVYFAYNNAVLDGAARQVVAEAAENVRRGGTSRVEVVGHTDTAGTPPYNERLSLRRAQVVATELARRGVPRAGMDVAGFGEYQLAVQTADGVREPRNRRVEIVLR